MTEATPASDEDIASLEAALEHEAGLLEAFWADDSGTSLHLHSARLMRDAAARLRAETAAREAAEREREEFRSALATMCGRCKAAEDALRPFADAADEWAPECNGGHPFPDSTSLEHAAIFDLNVGHLRRAKALLERNSDNAR